MRNIHIYFNYYTFTSPYCTHLHFTISIAPFIVPGCWTLGRNPRHTVRRRIYCGIYVYIVNHYNYSKPKMYASSRKALISTHTHGNICTHLHLQKPHSRQLGNERWEKGASECRVYYIVRSIEIVNMEMLSWRNRDIRGR